MIRKVFLLSIVFIGLSFLVSCGQRIGAEIDIPEEIRVTVESDMVGTYPTAEKVHFQDYQTLDNFVIVGVTFKDTAYQDACYPDRFCIYVLAPQADDFVIVYQTGDAYPAKQEEYAIFAWGFELEISGSPLILVVDSVCVNNPNIKSLLLYEWDGRTQVFSIRENQGLFLYPRWNEGEHLQQIEAFDQEGTYLGGYENRPPVLEFEIPCIDLPTDE